MTATKDKINGDFLGTGRRKSSVARVRIREGSGKVVVNKRDVNEYFTNDQQRKDVMAPLAETGSADRVDVIVLVHGGGITGQAGACKLGLARALKNFDPELEPALREKNLLTRDSRMSERKKPGLHKARKGTQFSKR